MEKLQEEIRKLSEKEQRNNDIIGKHYISQENLRESDSKANLSTKKIKPKENQSNNMFNIFKTEKQRKTRTRTSNIKSGKKSMARSFSMENVSKSTNKRTLNSDNKYSGMNQSKFDKVSNFKFNEEEEDEKSSSDSESKEDTNNLEYLIEKQMRQMKDKMMSKIDKYKKILERNYDNHCKKIKASVMQRAKRISQVINNNMKRIWEKKNSSQNFEEYNQFFMNRNDSQYSNSNESNEFQSESPHKEYEYMRKYTQKNLDEKMTQIFDIHEKIESSIDKNFEILNNFLINFDISQKYPMENFVNENADAILDSWIFSKINFEKLNMINFIENDKIPNNLKKFIYQDTFNKFSIISVKKSKNYDFDKNLMYENHMILEKLSFKNLEHEEFKKIFSQLSVIDGLKFNKLKELLIEDCILESTNFNHLFPNTERILIKNSLMKLNLTNVSKDFSKLKILSIKDSNFNNNNFSSLLEDFANNREILENLEIIDLGNNKLTGIDLSTLSTYNLKFFALQIFILNKNKIYKFKPQNLNCLPALKFLNLCSNNFTCPKDFTELQEKSKKLTYKNLILMGNNFFSLNSQKHNQFYIRYIIDTLKDFDFILRKLDLRKIFNYFNKNSLLEIHLNTNIQISLKKLNLSFCSLDSKILFDFIKQNSGFINLRTLDVSENFIDDYFFEMYDEENLFNLMENLEVLKLRNNKITVKSIQILENMLIKQKKLNKIYLEKNPIENSFVELIRWNPGLRKFNSCDNLISCNKLLLSNDDSREISPEEVKSNHLSQDIDRSKFHKIFDNLINLKKENFKFVFSKKAETLCEKIINNLSGSNEKNNSGNISVTNGFTTNIETSSEKTLDEILKKKEFILKNFIRFER